MQLSLEGDLQEDEEAILKKLKQYLLANYKPAIDPQKADLHFSTEEIYQKLLKLYPNELVFRPAMVAEWLEQEGFIFFEYGDLNFEWMMNKA